MCYLIYIYVTKFKKWQVIMIKHMRTGAIIAALVSWISAHADDAIKVWVEATATTSGIVPSITLKNLQVIQLKLGELLVYLQIKKMQLVYLVLLQL